MKRIPTENPEKQNGSGDVDPALLALLVCPLTKGPLTFDREACELVSERAKLAYPVRGGIAIMLPSEARSLDEGDQTKKTRKRS